MRFRALMVFTVVLVAWFTASCSQHSATQDPASPSLASSLPAKTDPDGLNNGHNLLGFWNIAVDSEKLTAQIVPQRTSDLHLNVISWLEASPCTDCLKITNLQAPDKAHLNVEITLK